LQRRQGLSLREGILFCVFPLVPSLTSGHERQNASTMSFIRNGRFLVAASAAVGLAALAVGFKLDSKNFAGNALAELAGLILSVLVAVLIVDRLVAQDRRRRWDLVSTQTIDTLHFALTRSGLALYLRLPTPRPPTADPFTMGIAGPSGLARALQDLAPYIRALDDSALGSPANWLPEVEEPIRLIREGLMPRLLAIGDPEVVAVASSVEGRFQDLLHAVWLSNRFGGEQIASAAADLCEAMGAAVAETQE
jgi:hypothetical protein